MTGTSNEGQLLMYDLAGKEILCQKSSYPETRLNVGFISTGLYLLKYMDSTQSINFKIIKF